MRYVDEFRDADKAHALAAAENAAAKWARWKPRVHAAATRYLGTQPR